MKKITKSILSLCTIIALILFSGCGETSNSSVTVSSAEFTVTPPFFKVENKANGAVVYMLGSMHVGKKGAGYPEKIYNALDESDTLAVEVDTQALENNDSEMREALQILMCQNGTSFKDYAGGDYDGIVAKFREKGLYNAAYEAYIPALWTSLWSTQTAAECGYSADFGTDVLLMTYAKAHGKKIDEIESAKEQYQVEADSSAALQIYILNGTITSSADENQEAFDELYNAWKSADMDKLKALAEEEDEDVTGDLKADYDSYYDKMYTLRQKKMAEYVMSKLKSGGTTFMVVGAMHYAAPPSILDVLKENGYEYENLNA